MKTKRYTLINKTPIEESDLEKWKFWYAKSDRLVQSTDIPMSDENRFLFKISDPNCIINVSTVFLGVDHSLFSNLDDKPILFETKITGGQYDQRRQWTCTWEEAECEHQFTLDALFQGGFICQRLK
ncbi:hypothetical protein [sulfur-oxidizing endosymbiont of Gigantopelta aegis]|uniref:hypothetical protein n=1 Tax=sulfur-oxidizing endosymbiont of Gigantopelta aegis TaxID=2794934 RepID=UPI0018DDAAD5|nr:hypothetical protein [sulfur-oxidizing endosymbiont of Gigantopelta aegis]